MGWRPFLLFVNIGGVDSAGHSLGSERYLEIVEALDKHLGRLAEACSRSNALLVITSDHGMTFPFAGKGRGGHATGEYSERLESLRVPLVVKGPGAESMNLAGIWSQECIAPTVLSMIGVSHNLSAPGGVIPIAKSYDLLVTGLSGREVAVFKDQELVARSGGEDEIAFKGLERGCYKIWWGCETSQVCLNGELTLDLAGAEDVSGWLHQNSMRKIIGLTIILAINLIGAMVIFRIAKKG